MTTFADPVDAFRAAVDALNAEEWAAAARLCDPVSLRSFHRQLIEQFSDSAMPPFTVDDLLRQSPDMPREVAEYQVAEYHRRPDRRVQLQRELPGVPSVEALRSMESADAFAAWLKGHSFRTQIEHMLAEGRVLPRAARAVLDAPMRAQYQFVTLGAVRDGERMAHVLYRMTVDERRKWDAALEESLARLPADEEEFMRDRMIAGYAQTAPCRKQEGGGWAVIADRSFLGTGTAFITEMSSSEESE